MEINATVVSIHRYKSYIQLVAYVYRNTRFKGPHEKMHIIYQKPKQDVSFIKTKTN
jgi:hypothetical protein